MTCREKLKMEHPEYINEKWEGGCFRCPSSYKYLPNPDYCANPDRCHEDNCKRCWDREIPEKTCIDEYVEEKSEKIDKNMIYAHMGFSEEQAEAIEDMIEGKKTPNDIRDTLGLPHILDSGSRREFESGAVRDIQEGKGDMASIPWESILRLSVHYEGGAKKYERWNFRKGIPVSSFIDSACRHLAKYQCGCDDEDHLAAAAFNVLGAMLMENTRPEMQDLPLRKGKNTFDYFKKSL